MTSLPSSSPSVGSSPGVARGDSFSLNMASANTKTAPSPPQQQQTNAPTQPNGTHAHATAPAAAPAPSTLPLPPSLPVSVALSSPSPSVTPHLINKPSFLELPKFRFLIMDAPNDDNLPAYIEVCKKKQVVALARICDPCYSTAPLLAAGINVIEVPFADGDPPPPHVVDKWLALVDQVFKHGGKNDGTGIDLDMRGIEKPAIAAHCVAGLGRAPVLVAIALVESGMEPFDAIAFIRKKRRGAINARQLKYIENYKRRNEPAGCCTIQ